MSRRLFLRTLATLLLAATATISSAQAQSQNPVNPGGNGESVNDSLHDLQAQVAELKSLVVTMRDEVEESRAETRELRRELESEHAQASAASPNNPAPNQASGSSSLEQRLSKVEEDQALLSDKVDDQYQTKVESASKYRVRFSGIALFNLYNNVGSLDNQDFPEFATIPATGQSGNSFGGSFRQSELGFEVFGPDVLGAKTSANVQFDFAGGFPNAPNGIEFGIVRLRTGSARFDWGNTSIIAGQDTLFISPLAPSSIASIAQPALSYSGELWSWTPQVRVEHRIALSDSSQLLLQGGVLASLSGEAPAATYDRQPQAGELSGQPAYAGRIAWSHQLVGRSITIGEGGYYGRQNWGFDRNVNAWAATTDWTFPLAPKFDLSGEFYRGSAVGGLGGGLGESAFFVGTMANPATVVRGLDSMGGWTQLKFRATEKLEFNGAFGQDNPFASELWLAAAWQQIYPSLLARNQSSIANFIYRPRSDLLFSVEYLRLKTFTLHSAPESANHVSMNVGVLF
jgi:hypothetical protein